MNRPSRSSLSGLSRRTALGRVAAIGAALGLSSRVEPTAAWEATPAPATTHPVVGLWQNAVTGTGGMPWTFSLYHADGTYHEWNGLKLGSALGIWRPTGARTAELMFVYQDTDPAATREIPGTVTFRMTIAADATSDALTVTGDLDLRTPDGRLVVAEPNIRWTSQRMTFDRNPATGSTAPAEPIATPTE